MKLIFFALSENAIIDQKTNKLSVINVLDNSITEGYPTLIPNLAASSIFEREDGDQDNTSIILKLSFNETVLIEAPLELNFLTGVKRTRNIVSIAGVMVPMPGIITAVLLKMDGNEISRYSIEFQTRIEINPRT